MAGSERDAMPISVKTALTPEAARQRVIAERLLLTALREQDNARAALEKSSRDSFLAAASRELSMSLDQETTRSIVQHRSLPREGTWCIVDVLETNGTLQRLTV